MKAKHFSSEAKEQKTQRKFTVKKVQSRAVIDLVMVFFKTNVQRRAVFDFETIFSKQMSKKQTTKYPKEGSR